MGPLTPKLEKVIHTLDLWPKSVLGLTSTVGLIERLTVDRALRRICGFPLCKQTALRSHVLARLRRVCPADVWPNGCMRRSSRNTSGMN
jgi:hypothetical protein